MFLADYHVHTSFSHDCKRTMREMADALFRSGMTEACFTDHVDIISCRRFGFWHTPNCYAGRDSVARVFHRIAGDYAGRLELRLGIELSGIQEDPETARTIAADPALDMIIGSIHNLRGTNDFYYLNYSDPRQNDLWAARYLEEYREVAGSGCCDILGHIGYITRYMSRQGTDIDLMNHADLLKALYCTAIQNGVGIEVNTSGLRCAANCTFPTIPMLRLYRACGGEIITVGSDAHLERDVGYAIDRVYALLRTLGFRYIATFRKRVPEFQKL